MLSGACISLVGYFKDIKSGRTKHSCVEINRLDGFIKLPDDRFRYVIPFENVHFHLTGGGNTRVTIIYLAMILPSTVGNIVRKIPFFDRFYENKIIEALSIFVWYMDKNRPLPPGTEFDKFRQKDFERRKAEGFPPPMYRSHIPTPEATAEQQAERENFWKDEDYKVTDMTTRDLLLKWNKESSFKVKYSHLKTPKK